MRETLTLLYRKAGMAAHPVAGFEGAV